MMKKLICSLLVAMMFFNTVISVEGLNRYGKRPRPQIGLIDEVQTQRRVRQRTEGTFSTGSVELLNHLLAIDDINSENIIRVLDRFELNNSNLQILSDYIFSYRSYLYVEDIVDIYFYLINRGVTVEQISNLSMLELASSTGTSPELRRNVLNEISIFCKKFGTVCILATGDIIDSEGKIYNYKGEEYDGDGLDSICEDGYWHSNSGRLINCFNYAYGLFILPDERCFSCSYKDALENDFINLSSPTDYIWYEEGSPRFEKLTISRYGVTLADGKTFSPKHTGNGIDGDVEECLLKQGISQVVFDLVRHGNATSYVKYLMQYMCDFDEFVRSYIYGSEETLKGFVIDNFCQDSLFLALQSLEKKYNQEHGRA